MSGLPATPISLAAAISGAVAAQGCTHSCEGPAYRQLMRGTCSLPEAERPLPAVNNYNPARKESSASFTCSSASS